MANIVKLGSLLLDGAHTEPESEYQPGQAISFADGNDLRWVVVNGILIADRCLLLDVSWDDLNFQGLSDGRQIAINGRQFLCRLLKAGIEQGVQNEWDDALAAVGDDDSLWHWSTAWFWEQDAPDEYEPYRALRGFLSVRSCNWNMPSYRHLSSGFRPALVPLSTDHLTSGIEVCAIGGQSVLYGTLLGASDYDAIIRPTSTSMMAEADEGKCYSKLPDGTVILDRTSMVVQTIKEK